MGRGASNSGVYKGVGEERGGEDAGSVTAAERAAVLAVFCPARKGISLN